MYCVNIRSRDKIMAEMNNQKLFHTKEEAEKFLEYVKNNGLTGIDFDFYDLVGVEDVAEQEYDVENAFIEKCEKESLYLVFTSFSKGGHANTLHRSPREACDVIKQYIELENSFGNDVSIEEVAGEEDTTFDAICLHLEKNEDVFVRMDDGTWFTITRVKN